MPFNVGLPELIILLGIALLVFGPKKLPELGSVLGKSVQNFKASLSSSQTSDNRNVDSSSHIS